MGNEIKNNSREIIQQAVVSNGSDNVLQHQNYNHENIKTIDIKSSIFSEFDINNNGIVSQDEISYCAMEEKLKALKKQCYSSNFWKNYSISDELKKFIKYTTVISSVFTVGGGYFGTFANNRRLLPGVLIGLATGLVFSVGVLGITMTGKYIGYKKNCQNQNKREKEIYSLEVQLKNKKKEILKSKN